MAEGERWKPYTQRQGQLLPAFVEDALEPSDPVFFITDVVASLDLAPLAERHAVLGEHAYSPRLLLKVWRYGATPGVYRRFALRGVAQVRGEWALVCAAFDRRRLCTLALTGT